MAFVAVMMSTSIAVGQSTVTLYGIGDGNFRVDHTNVGTLKSVSSGGAAGSRWGIRGSEDLGDGLKANFVFEQGFDLSDNSVPQGNIAGVTPTTPTSSTGGRLFSRIATVGLSSDTFGNLRFGHDYRPIFRLYVLNDAFGAGYVGTEGNIAPRLIPRFDNAVFYDSPTFAGFRLSVAYGFGESSTDTTPGTPKNAGARGGAGVFYTRGPLSVSYAYNNDSAGATSPLIGNRLNRVRVNEAGVVYDFDIVKINLFYWSNKDDLGYNVRSGAIGASIPFGVWTFKLGYGHLNDLGSSTPTDPTARTNFDSNFYGLAAVYSFSKRTTLYASASAFKNHHRGAYGIMDANGPGVNLFTPANLTGTNPWAAQTGITHLF